MINPVFRMRLFAAAIVINTLLIPFNMFVINNMEMAFVNFLSGLLCWPGYIMASNEIKKTKDEE